MGHALDEWGGKVAELLKDFAGVDLDQSEIEVVGLRPAFAEHSANSPRVAVVEVAGAGSGYFALPGGWEPGRSFLTEVEYPARNNPPTILDPKYYTIAHSIADPTVDRILLRYLTPTVSQFVRFSYTASWPFPTTDADDDLLDDAQFEAVSALAAAYCCDSLASEAARDRSAAMPSDFSAGTDRNPRLVVVAEHFRETYRRLSGASWFVA